MISLKSKIYVAGHKGLVGSAIVRKCYFRDISKQFLYLYNLSFLKYKNAPGDYCEGVIPDPIPNSEVKPFSADGTLS